MSDVMDMAALQEMAVLMDSRANVYRVLSRCFREEIDQEFADELTREFSFESDDEDLVAKLEAMKDALRDVDENAIEQLAVVFDRVFFGMGPLTAHHAFPYESVYTSDRGIMMQEAYSQVVRAYREQHLAKDASFKEPEDHIAVELAFMATLSDRTAAFLRDRHEEAASATVEQQKAFAEAHLTNWLDRFSADLRKATDGGFYFHLADFTEAFVVADVALLTEMLS